MSVLEGMTKLGQALSQSYTATLENEIRLNVRKPRWMPWWAFRRLMGFIVIEQTPLRWRLENAMSVKQKEGE